MEMYTFYFREEIELFDNLIVNFVNFQGDFKKGFCFHIILALCIYIYIICTLYTYTYILMYTYIYLLCKSY